MRCDDLAERLTDFLEGELEPEIEEQAIEHLATCDRCEVVLAETREVSRLARDHGKPVVEESDRDRMFGAIRSRLEEGETG